MPAAAPRWDSAQYLRFEAERTLPCRDLVRRIDLDAPARLLDLGCGPGTSTAVLLEQWPSARAIGVDSSEEMLARARSSGPRAEWVLADLRTWDPEAKLDLVFSNAVLQWVDDHPARIPRLWSWVGPGGALAFQVPARGEPPAAWVEALDELRRRPAWRSDAADDEARSNVLPLARYYDLLRPDARRVDLWDTEYDHVLDGPEAIVEWLRGTALRRWLERLDRPGDRDRFLAELTEEIRARYPRRSDGSVLFPFLRRFVVAYR